MKNPKLDNKLFGLERNIFFTGLTSFLTDTSTKMVYSVMSLFLVSIGASKSIVGLIEGIAESTASVLKAMSGFWSDKIGRNKPFMLIGYIMTALVTPIYAVTVAPIQILLLRFTERVGKGIRTAPRDSLIAGSSPSKNTGKSFGFHKAMDNCGAIVGPLLAFLILYMFGQKGKQIDPHICRIIFVLAAIPAVLGVLNIAFFIREAKKSKEEIPQEISLKSFSKRFYIFLAIVFVFTLGNSADTFLLLRANDIGFTAGNIPLVYLLFNACSVIFAVPAGILSDKIGRERLIVFGYVIYAIVYFGFGGSNVKAVMLLLLVLYGLYSAATDGVQKALVSDLVDKDKRGTGMGIYNSILGITLLPASLIAGVLYDNVSSSAPFYFGGATAIVAAVLMAIFYIKRPRPGIAE
ncbi:MAG TPA: MFS transporter [Clostridia bacterium]|nr:MFS transporter [Clostridia bacterium]